MTVRADEEADRALVRLTGDGTSKPEAIRRAILAEDERRFVEQIRADSEKLRNDPADLAEIKRIHEELDDIRAW